MVLVSSATASSSSSIIFTLSSYNIYKFFYVNVHQLMNPNFNLIYQQIMGLIIMLQKQQHHGGAFLMRQEMILV